MVLNGGGTNLVSTMGNPFIPQVLTKRAQSKLITAEPTTTQINRVSSGSVYSGSSSSSTLDTHVSQIKEQYNQPGRNLEISMNKKLVSLFL